MSFVLSLKNPNFLTMKMLNEVFNKMSTGDEVTRRIVENLGALSCHEIVLDGDVGIENYVLTQEDLSLIVIFFSTCCTEEVACHEFGHLLLDLFSSGRCPENYDEVISGCRERMLERKDCYYEMFEGFSTKLFQKLVDDDCEFRSFLEHNPEIRERFFEENDEATEDEFLEEARIHYFANVTTFDIEAENYNKIANVVDSIFLNDGPFYMAYGNDEYFPVLAMHDDEYFLDGDSGADFVSFEEQFADYVVLRVYKDKMGFALDRLYDMLGEEWFIMMDNYYEEVVGRMSEKGKTFVKKGDTK